MWASSSSTSTTTAPAGRAPHDVGRQPAGQHGHDRRPRRSPSTDGMNRQVESRCRSGEARCPRARRGCPTAPAATPPRLDTARPAVPRASTRTSRSHRNFTAAHFLVSLEIRQKTVVGPVDCGRPTVRAGQGGRSSPAVVPSVAQIAHASLRTRSGQRRRLSTVTDAFVPSSPTGIPPTCPQTLMCALLDPLGQLVDLVVDLALLAHHASRSSRRRG